jgi:hypothetical protein
MLFREHIQYLAKKNMATILEYSFRNKMKVWDVYYYYYRRNNESKIRIRKDYYYSDSYYVAFMKNLGLRECCYKCKYVTLERQGDFTIADWWGIDKVRPEIPREKGVSLIFINTDKAASVFKQIDTLQTWETKPEDAIPHQGMLRRPEPRPRERDTFYNHINDHGYAKWADQFYSPKASLIRHTKYVAHKIIKILPSPARKIGKRVVKRILNRSPEYAAPK